MTHRNFAKLFAGTVGRELSRRPAVALRALQGLTQGQAAAAGTSGPSGGCPMGRRWCGTRGAGPKLVALSSANFYRSCSFVVCNVGMGYRLVSLLFRTNQIQIFLVLLICWHIFMMAFLNSSRVFRERSPAAKQQSNVAEIMRNKIAFLFLTGSQ